MGLLKVNYKGFGVKKILLLSVAFLGVLSFISCDKEERVSNSTEEPSGTLQIAFNRNEEEIRTILNPIAEEFMQKYPKVEAVTFEFISGDSDVLRSRIASGQFHDITMIPENFPKTELYNFFAPYGDTEELVKTYRYADAMSQDGKTYAFPIGMTANGMIYNKTVIDTYLDGEVPLTREEFYQAAEVLDNNDIIPLWTNAGTGWAMRFFDQVAVIDSGNPDYRASMIENREPWAKGSPLYRSTNMLEDFARNGWIEPDTVQYLWDNSTRAMVEGKIGFMFLGYWALPQLETLSKKLGYKAGNIGFAAIPYSDKVSASAKSYISLAPDISIGINKNSKNIPAAKAFMEFWMASDGPKRIGFMTPLISGGVQPEIQELLDTGLHELFEEKTPPIKFDQIFSEAGLDLFVGGGWLVPHVIEPAKANKAIDYQELNTIWSDAIDYCE